MPLYGGGGSGSIPTVTKRVCTPLMGSGFQESSAGSVQDALLRTLMVLPVTTTQWRLRIRNFATSNTEANGVGVITIPSVYVGAPNMSDGGGRWTGKFAAAPSLALASFASDAAFADVASPWVTSGALQFTAGRLQALSIPFQGSGTNRVYYDATGSLYWQGTGTPSTQAGVAAPSGIGSPSNLMALDLRLEYEFTTPVAAPVRVLLALGDSITMGKEGGDGGCYPFETWPAATALRQRACWVNLGVDGAKAQDFAASSSAWKWTRCDIATTLPDTAYIALGSNDLAASTSSATLQGYISTIIANLQALGINDIALCTVIPRNFGATIEAQRVIFNNWLRGLTGGVAVRVIDHDKQVCVQATPATMDGDLISTAGSPYTNPHPKRGGYQRMASA